MEKADFLFQWWQSFTPGGMVLIAYGPQRRFFVLSTIIALIGSLAVTWFFIFSWKPVIEEAILHLPEQAEIAQGILHWHHSYPVVLAKNSFLSITVDSEGNDNINQSADFQFELGRDDFRLGSLFGFVRFEYSPTIIMDLGRPKIQPWWGAWHPILIFGLGLASFAGLLFIGSLLGLLYAIPLWLICKIFRKSSHFLNCWRLALTGQTPGAIWLSLALFLYSINHLDITGFLISLLIYFLLAGIYLLLILFFIPRMPRHPNDINPFTEKPSNSFSEISMPSAEHVLWQSQKVAKTRTDNNNS